MDSSPNTLSDFQRMVLVEFFRGAKDFFLTGGAALAGFYLGHRTTSDLDLFTLDGSAMEPGRRVLQGVADRLGATLEIREHSPGFQRLVLERPDEALVVDLVWDRAPGPLTTKRIIEGIPVDPIEEILANKLTAVVGRCEERDLVDLMFLERAGHRVEDALATALAKDGGCTPATLAWLLSETHVPDGTPLPAEVSAGELRDYLDDLVKRLRRLAAPRGQGPVPE